MANDIQEQIDDLFADFINGQQSDESIKQLYETLPYLTQDQQRVLTLYSSLAVKYNSPVLRDMATNIETFAKKNRRTGIRFTRLLEAFSLFKHFKGYKASSSSMNDMSEQ